MTFKYFIIVFSIFLLTSCSTRKEIVYFQGAEQLDGTQNLMEFEPVFEVNDIIYVRVTSMNEVVAAPFQMQTGGQAGGGGGGGMQRNPSLMGYMVDVNGNIQFPVLGEIEVAGKSRSELEAYLTKEIRRYVTDAVVAVRLLNFRVIVLGESGATTVVPVENERISIPELIASVGDITYNGIRDKIMIIREVDGVRSVGYVDMTSADVFNNPYYYLKQNDIVYVEPTLRQVKSAGWITNWQGLVSIATTALSLIILFTR
ncbi:sugar transporter [Antarcticibacterium flavum]|uniref:Sugar transporter n=2 Tax=Antarcticibacterium TaxID=2058174 RepID=A0A5B7X8E0_9FLAO|nr:polysaccharide biosynthesis/export family protein [Antarcticibacterium flavum]MCM4158754.1 sugar transporter [Antarcticibacterium sp. W02-3]QCY71350.1 sugar transporter [Antarcticibacterium flavum]